MKNKKVLVVSGCSFTFEPWNWPKYVAEEYNLEIYNVGMGSMGNRLISRRVIAKIEQLLQEYKPEDILVGIMWSGSDRLDTWVPDNEIPSIESTQKLGFRQNPVHISDEEHKNFWITNMHWTDNFSIAKGMYTNDVDNFLSTITDMLFAQYYLKAKGLDYFMTSFVDIFTGNHYWDENNSFFNYPDIKFFYNMIDQSKFTQENCNDWCWENQNEPGHYVKQENLDDKHPVGHPNALGHEMYSKNVLIPFINKLYA